MSTTFCRHIRPSGRRCQSPSLRDRPFCYFHQAANAQLRALHPPVDGTSNVHVLPDCDQIRREPILQQYFANSRSPIELEFPPIEDPESIQLSLSMVLTALGQNRIDPKRAAAILYNLQIAVSIFRHVSPIPKPVVTDPVLDEAGNLIAPDQDPDDVLEVQDFLVALEQERAANYQSLLDEGYTEDDAKEKQEAEDFA
jgi:hypothetical protein